MARVALIGLGLVGHALASRLLQAGHHVRGFDLNPERGAALAALGGVFASSACEAVAGGEVCLFSLPTATISAQVAEQLQDSLRGLTVIDTTTGRPEEMVQIARRLSAVGAEYLDATLVGSSRHVAEGNAQFLVGGPKETFERHRPLLSCLARETFYLGEAGSGARMKLVVNLVLGLQRAALAEGLAFAEHLGIDPAVALPIMQSGLAYSRVMDTKGPKMLSGDFTPEARLSQHHKDVRLILELARSAGAAVPLSELHEQLLTQAESLGWGDQDNSAIVNVFRNFASTRTEDRD